MDKMVNVIAPPREVTKVEARAAGVTGKMRKQPAGTVTVIGQRGGGRQEDGTRQDFYRTVTLRRPFPRIRFLP